MQQPGSDAPSTYSASQRLQHQTPIHLRTQRKTYSPTREQIQQNRRVQESLPRAQVGDSYDNAASKSFFSTLKAECSTEGLYTEQAPTVIEQYITVH